ncbi:MAG: hypothetical protein LBE92_00585 [Chryseobacterium sp.]|jgi:hypothetical protein|uniref:hypothetical protein n=1 Tax=Chryseobacterium sp. TaxID=1871047 RepID=UPI00282F5430|nr:hypothetical protein [Chryseobacterium sp.]MDR2234595.1 hypothetical protein [Chryseobacterium sp.]
MGGKLAAWTGIFFLLFMLFFPLDFLGNFQREISVFLFGGLTEWISGTVFGIRNARIDFSSDSISMVIFIGILLIISAFITVIVPNTYHKKVISFSKEAAVFYLVVILMEYGFNKLFKAQFYLPEPNILFSRFGNLDRDILFWSTMGTSRSYSWFSGGTELLAAVLILFSRTRIPGLLMSVGIFINILAINIGFDISVKLFSLLLLLMAVFALKDVWLPLFRFLIVKEKTKLTEDHAEHTALQPILVFLKTAFLGSALVLILFPYFNSGIFNDDKAERPPIHGAFKNKDENSDLQYIFFHRDHYMILMDKKERMRDFHYVQGAENLLFLEDSYGKKIRMNVSYQKKDSLIVLHWGSDTIQAKALNWKKMNALQPLFHTIIEKVE